MEEYMKICGTCSFAEREYAGDTFDCIYIHRVVPRTFYCKGYVEKIQDPIAYIKENVSERGLLESLAEEAAELSKAALKMIRVLDSVDDAYPVDPNEYNYDTCKKNLIEEVTDVGACCMLLDIHIDKDLANKKTLGMVERIENSK